jgi:tRNA pseudouridine38-40 synthase
MKDNVAKRYKLIISYDGTAYCGWQVQENQKSIQALVQQALQTALRHPLDLTGAGRTDSGVHARGQTAHFDSPVSFLPSRLLLSLNALLPPDIRILGLEPAASDFHARYSSVGKIYHYHLQLDPVSDPFNRLYRTQIFSRIDLDLLKKAAHFFIGTHDFTSFANLKESGNPAQDSIRTLKRLDVIDQKGGVRLEFEGNGFLYKMVRNMTGTLLDVGRGKIEPERILEILKEKDRRKAGPAAPPQGLILDSVLYAR